MTDDSSHLEENLEKAIHALPAGWMFREKPMSNAMLTDAESLKVALLGGSTDNFFAILHDGVRDVTLHVVPSTGTIVVSPSGPGFGAILSWVMKVRASPGVIHQARLPSRPSPVSIQKAADWHGYVAFLQRHEQEIHVRVMDSLWSLLKTQELSVRVVEDGIKSPLREQVLAFLGAW